MSILIIATLLMGCFDLALTLEYATSVGMVEVNPLARWLMQSVGAPWALGMWKLVTMGVAAIIIYRVRTKRIGELGAWCGFLMLAGLSIHWLRYANESERIAAHYDLIEDFDHDGWVMMGDESP